MFYRPFRKKNWKNLNTTAQEKDYRYRKNINNNTIFKFLYPSTRVCSISMVFFQLTITIAKMFLYHFVHVIVYICVYVNSCCSLYFQVFFCTSVYNNHNTFYMHFSKKLQVWIIYFKTIYRKETGKDVVY